MTWQKAAGFIGQFVLLMKLILYFAVFIIFLVALVIINNALVMATLQRVHEIGTLRAIGAQRRFVLALCWSRPCSWALVFGAAGPPLGAADRRMAGAVASPPATSSCTSSSPGRASTSRLGLWKPRRRLRHDPAW